MPQITIERDDLVKLLKGESLHTPIQGIRIGIADELLEEVPPSLIKDLTSYLEG